VFSRIRKRFGLLGDKAIVCLNVDAWDWHPQDQVVQLAARKKPLVPFLCDRHVAWYELVSPVMLPRQVIIAPQVDMRVKQSGRNKGGKVFFPYDTVRLTQVDSCGGLRNFHRHKPASGRKCELQT
jgi:hypothetical protein